MIYKIDTLTIEVSYWKNNDSIPEIVELKTDTLNLVVPRDAAKNKKNADKSKKQVKVRRTEGAKADSAKTEPEQPPVIPLQVNVSPSGAINPYDIITIVFNEPVMDVRKEFFVMETRVDTLWETVDFEFEEDTVRAMTYHVKREFKYDETYRLTIDSAVLRGVYGHCNLPLSTTITVNGRKEYGHIVVIVQGLPSEGDSGRVVPAYMELLNNNGALVRKAVVENGRANFMNMPPEKYYARIVLDTNGNGRWDAGNYDEKRQPEKVFYFMQQFEIRQNWDTENTWDISTSKPGEKPYELLKNKPKEETNKKRDYKEESKPRNRNSSSTNMRGLGGF
jgi:hypothetical protein